MKLDFENGLIDLSFGSGGRATAALVDQLFLKLFDNDWLNQKNDQACFEVQNGRMVVTTDSHVVSPLFFPGGDIGSLAVHGTINDVVMSGATPLYLSVGFILEEGFPLKSLKQIVKSMACAAREANMAIIAGDTKVVEKGHGDGVYITTTGIGIVLKNINISGNLAKPGDHVILSGYVGDHGIAIMSCREGLEFHSTLKSDSASLHDLVAAMINVVPDIHCLRDPTRGGVATVLNEFAEQSQVGFSIDETKIPVRDEVRGACELLGLDPLYIANEGKLIAICKAEDSEKLLKVMRSHPKGKHAEIIGEVIDDKRHFVRLNTSFGGTRILSTLAGEQLPRIC